jgi:hypothetical protein
MNIPGLLAFPFVVLSEIDSLHYHDSLHSQPLQILLGVETSCRAYVDLREDGLQSCNHYQYYIRMISWYCNHFWTGKPRILMSFCCDTDDPLEAHCYRSYSIY